MLFALLGASAGVFGTWLAGRRKSDLEGDTALVNLCDVLQKQVASQGRELLACQRGYNAREIHIEDLHRAASKLPDEARKEFYSHLHTKRPNGTHGEAGKP